MEPQNDLLKKAGHFVLWRGVFFVLFGLMAFFWAGLALWSIIIVFGFFAIADGIVLLAMYAKHHSLWGHSSLFFGILSILAGLYALFLPGLTALLLALFVAARAFVGGIFELRMATHLRKHVAGEVLLIANGILSILFALALGVLLVLHLAFGLFLLVEIIGLYAICLGVLLILLSLRIKKSGASLLVPKNTTSVF